MEDKKYIEFLRFCLSGKDMPESVKDINWRELLAFGKKQTIQGVFARMVLAQDENVRPEHFLGNKPSEDDVMEWVFETHILKKLNEMIFKRAEKASEWFFENGFPNCILKGQGNALMYPNPYLRVPGDVDIWLDGGREKILDFTTKYYQRKPTNLHVDFPMFSDVKVEVHFRPSYMLNPFVDRKLRKYFDEVKDAQFGNEASTADGKFKFFVPSNEFNALYQLMHMYRHVHGNGIGLRQVIDYYYLLKKCKAEGMGENEKKEFVRLVKKFRMVNFTSAIMYIMHDIFGLDDEYILFEPNKKEGEFLFKEVLLMGNFGKAETRKAALKTAKGHFKRFLIYEKYNLRVLDHYPSESIWRPLHDLKLSWRDHHMDD